MTLRAPPKPPHATASLVGRMLGLIVLLAGFAVAVWVTATNQQAGAIERANPFINQPGEHVVVGSLTVHVRTVGTGQPVTVLVHDDSIAGGALLESTAEELAAGGGTVVVPDLIGYGLSSRLAEPGQVYTSIGQATVLADLIDELELGPVEIAGFGWGAGVAADLAVTRPEVVSRLVLVDASALTQPTTGWHSLMAMPFGLGQAVAYTMEGGSARAETAFLSECPGPADCADPGVVEARRRAAEVPGTAASIRARRATAAASVATDRIGEVSVPVLIVSTTGREAVAGVAELIEGAEIEVVSGPEGLTAAIAGT